ncbi:MAG: nucleoside triphosphate pyrophosphohydrolase [Spirochaetota bacterium]
MEQLTRLKEIMDTLRGENGCNWDKKQTATSLIPYILEESYEVVDAIQNEDPDHIKEELGDLLFNVFFQARIAEENEQFTINEVAKEVSDKLVRRHPHVFENQQDIDAKQVLANWEKIKENEKKNKQTKQQFLLDEIPNSLPSLLYAEKLQRKAAKVGFDWEEAEDVLGKVKEEVSELEEASGQSTTNQEHLEEELGDALFALVNLSRFYDISPEKALRGSCQKFKKRFSYIESQAGTQKTPLEEMSLAEMDALWTQAKKLEKK